MKISNYSFFKLLCSLVLLVLASVYSFASEGKWELVNSCIESNKQLYGIAFSDENNGWLIGADGYVANTSNAGNTWKSNDLKILQGLYDICFVSKEIGYIIGDRGLILKTTNEGASWDKQNSGVLQKLNDVFFIDSRIGWICGTNGKVLRTKDGGTTWQITSTNTINSIESLSFSDSLHGLAVGEFGLVLKTSNGGETWVNSTKTGNESLYSIINQNDSVFIACGANGTIYSTRDFGDSWKKEETGTNEKLYKIILNKITNIFAVGSNGKCLKSTNQGQNWTATFLVDSVDLTSICVLNNGTLWGCGLNSNLYYTEDGSEWISKGFNFKSKFYGVDFLDKNNGWLVGDSGRVFKTTNSGKIWRYLNIGKEETLYGVNFRDSLNGYITGKSSIFVTTNANTWNKLKINGIDANSITYLDTMIYATLNNGAIVLSYDKGKSWIETYKILDNNNYFISFIYCLNKDTLLICTNSGFLRSTNGGVNWSESLLSNGAYITGLYFDKNKTGWATTSAYDNVTYSPYAELYKTNNAGNSWEKVLTNDKNYYFIALAFIDDSNGWMSGERIETKESDIYRTIDGGKTWNATNISGRVNEIKFIDRFNGWIFGSKGIFYSSNRGEDWTSQVDLSSYYPELSIYPINFCTKFIDPNNAWAVNDIGEIYKYTNNIVGVREEPNFEIDDFIIIYPNPCSEYINIKFKDESLENFEILIYDYLGRLICTDSKINDSNVSITDKINISSLASGAYRLVIKSKDKIASKMFTVVK